MAKKTSKTPTPAPAAPKRRGRKPKQTDIPGTEQKTDDVLERAWLDRVAAVDDAKSAAEAKATAEATIQRRFEELAEADPEDPRAHAYQVQDGSTLLPQRKMKLSIKRPKAKLDEAADRLADPDLPDDDYGPDA